MLNLQLLCPCFVHLDNLAYLQHALDQKTPLLLLFGQIKKIIIIYLHGADHSVLLGRNPD